MIRVVHICQRDDHATGGASRVAVELVKRFPRDQVNAQCVFVYGISGTLGAEIPDQASHLGLRSSREAVWRYRVLRDFLQRTNPDIIHHHDGLTWTHWITKQFRSAIKVGHAHLGPPPTNAPLRSKFANWFHRNTYEHLFCISHVTQQSWVQSGFPESRCTLVANGVDTERFRPSVGAEFVAIRKRWNIPESARVVGFVGRLQNETKGCEDFIRIIAALPDDYWGVVAGAGPDENYLKRLAETLLINHRLRFLGLQYDIENVYRGLDIFIMSSRYEAFGLVVLEAAASGIPVIALPATGGVTGLVAELGMIGVNSRDPSAIARVVVDTVNTAKRDSFPSKDIRSRIMREYSWDSTCASVVETYSRVLNNRS